MVKKKKTISDPIVPPILQDGELIDQHPLLPPPQVLEDFKSRRAPTPTLQGPQVLLSCVPWRVQVGILEEEDFLAPLKLYGKEKEFKERTEKGGK